MPLLRQFCTARQLYTNIGLLCPYFVTSARRNSFTLKVGLCPYFVSSVRRDSFTPKIGLCPYFVNSVRRDSFTPQIGLCPYFVSSVRRYCFKPKIGLCLYCASSCKSHGDRFFHSCHSVACTQTICLAQNSENRSPPCSQHFRFICPLEAWPRSQGAELCCDVSAVSHGALTEGPPETQRSPRFSR